MPDMSLNRAFAETVPNPVPAFLPPAPDSTAIHRRRTGARTATNLWPIGSVGSSQTRKHANRWSTAWKIFTNGNYCRWRIDTCFTNFIRRLCRKRTLIQNRSCCWSDNIRRGRAAWFGEYSKHSQLGSVWITWISLFLGMQHAGIKKIRITYVGWER